MQSSLERLIRVALERARARRVRIACWLGAFAVLSATASVAAAELINDPYVLNFSDGAGAVAFNVPSNTGVPAVFDLSYGSWSVAFVGQNLEVVLTIDPMTGTPQLQPAVGVSGLDWTPVSGVITGFVRDPQSEPILFDLTVIGIPDSVSASSTSSAALVNAGDDPATALWRWEIQVEHVPEPGTLVTGLISGLVVAVYGWRRHRRN